MAHLGRLSCVQSFCLFPPLRNLDETAHHALHTLRWPTKQQPPGRCHSEGLGNPTPEEKFKQWEGEIGESWPDKFFFPTPTGRAEASFLDAAYQRRSLPECTCRVTASASLLSFSSVGQCSTASSCLPPPGPRGKHQWLAFASDQRPKGREPRQEAACGLPGNSFAAMLVARAPLLSSRGRRAAPREGPRREDVPAREGEGGAASASCEQRLRRPGGRGLGETPRGSRRRSRACCAARGGSGELLQGNCEPGPSRRRRPLRKCWERGGLRGGWRVPQCKLSVQSAQNARGAGQPQAGDAPLGFPRAAQQV